MANRLVCAVTLSLGFATTACSSMHTPKIEKNLHPTQRYEITVTVPGDVPRTFDSVNGTIQYQIGNAKACSPQDPISGQYRTLDQFQHVTFVRADEHTYKATVTMDPYIDADYFGMGMCHWTLLVVVAEMKTNGNPFDVALQMENDDITAQKSVDLYFPRSILSSDKGIAVGFAGVQLSEVPAGRVKDNFYITISARKVVL
jgi:hypothetical protein